jgi:2OG-Fe(II) oxygenase superfamily
MPHRIHVIENFITPEDAAVMIEEQLRPSEVNPYPEYYKTRFGGTNFPYNKRVLDLQVKYGRKSNDVHKELNGFVNPIYVFKGFGSHWEAGSVGGLHLDAQDPEPWIEWSTIIYLSDPADYEGGLIYFPNQDFEYKPKRYSAVFFPSAGSEYVHGITTVTSGHRFTALYMHTSLPQYADPDYHTQEETITWVAGNHPNTKK